jgi:hypothetical protein
MQQHWTVLDEFTKNNRRKFDPKNKADIQEFLYFKKNHTWKNACPFLLEWPYQDVIVMCLGKYADHMLKVSAKSPR